ncbi:hypothetical protein ABW21_db0207853 [Orbilia brochopaga]|nr:hypothetical protein ABW21_db0207853 [Drechslerella brochopaga]
MDSLPAELLLEIVKPLHGRDAWAIARTCRYFKRITTERRFESLAITPVITEEKYNLFVSNHQHVRRIYICSIPPTTHEYLQPVVNGTENLRRNFVITALSPFRNVENLTVNGDLYMPWADYYGSIAWILSTRSKLKHLHIELKLRLHACQLKSRCYSLQALAEDSATAVPAPLETLRIYSHAGTGDNAESESDARVAATFFFTVIDECIDLLKNVKTLYLTSDSFLKVIGAKGSWEYKDGKLWHLPSLQTLILGEPIWRTKAPALQVDYVLSKQTRLRVRKLFLPCILKFDAYECAQMIQTFCPNVEELGMTSRNLMAKPDMAGPHTGEGFSQSSPSQAPKLPMPNQEWMDNMTAICSMIPSLRVVHELCFEDPYGQVSTYLNDSQGCFCDIREDANAILLASGAGRRREIGPFPIAGVDTTRFGYKARYGVLRYADGRVELEEVSL